MNEPSMPIQPPPPLPKPADSGGLATSSLICGICGVLFGPLTGIPAIITGHIALGRMRTSGDARQAQGKAVAGLIMGYVFSALFVVIGLLAGAGFATANAALGKVRHVSCLSTATAIESAVNNFYAEYGTMPVKGTSDVTVLTSKDTDLLKALLGMDEELNPRSIRFLILREGKGNKNGIIYTKDGRGVVGLYDPWGGGYHVRLDLDFDEKLEVPGKTLVNRRVAVWSDGPDLIEGTADDIKTW